MKLWGEQIVYFYKRTAEILSLTTPQAQVHHRRPEVSLNQLLVSLYKNCDSGLT